METIDYLKTIYQCIASIDPEDGIDKGELYEIMRSAVYTERKRMTYYIDKLVKFADRMCSKYPCGN